MSLDAYASYMQPNGLHHWYLLKQSMKSLVVDWIVSTNDDVKSLSVSIVTECEFPTNLLWHLHGFVTTDVWHIHDNNELLTNVLSLWVVHVVNIWFSPAFKTMEKECGEVKNPYNSLLPRVIVWLFVVPLILLPVQVCGLCPNNVDDTNPSDKRTNPRTSATLQWQSCQ